MSQSDIKSISSKNSRVREQENEILASKLDKKSKNFIGNKPLYITFFLKQQHTLRLHSAYTPPTLWPHQNILSNTVSHYPVAVRFR